MENNRINGVHAKLLCLGEEEVGEWGAGEQWGGRAFDTHVTERARQD